ncbi:hypothetical protein BDP55DRAFT_568275 [Colletotrichum godetiae]|uniref:Uncharacterized protein n=1 Tax=Colletotrichum godetiae TaxID=1209918 RepID=A0AAJ0EM20_9PEZI|nr:uncharacterized protein BDP55DRAFT_568275 [Colletotrichum godetiae]KAK1656971.1 hypothetical protein BDP55DRAFT_568275 [Colletotrichum godetiae]
MPSDKDRLYIALYARGGAPKMAGLEDTYHWAFIVGPKTESVNSHGRRFHAKETMTFEGTPPTPKSRWVYENRETSLAPTSMLLIRVVIAKVKDKSRLQSIFEDTPLRPEVEGWNCVGWAKESFETALRDGNALGTSADNWKLVRDTVMWYIEKKKAEHRFDGTSDYDPTKAPTWDMLDNRELSP